MALLAKVQTGRQRRPLTLVVYGMPGVGKTSFAAASPAPIFFDLEGGSTGLDVARVPQQPDWESFIGDMRDLTTEKHQFRTVVVDTLDALESMAVKQICSQAGKKTLADFDWGAGYALLTQEWRLFLRALEVLREKREMNIVLIAHEHRKPFSDPELGSYEMYRPKLQDKVWALTNEWCDAVLFAQFEQGALEAKGQKTRAIVSGRRIIRTQRGTGYVAKNRFGLPPVMDLDWKTFEAAAQPVPVSELKAQFDELMSRADGDLKAKVTSYVAQRGETPEVFRAAIERLQTILAEKAA